QGPLLSRRSLSRQAENKASSAVGFTAALFEIIVEIDGMDAGLGSARVVRGVAIRVPLVPE
ncbi:MAG TPA: hypothetical protein VIC02_08720, partial [Kineobactrum sp.]